MSETAAKFDMSTILPNFSSLKVISNLKFRMDLALGNRADRYISPMRIQNFRARWGFLYPPLVNWTADSRQQTRDQGPGGLLSGCLLLSCWSSLAMHGPLVSLSR